MFETIKFTLRIMKKRPLRSLLTILQLGLGVWIVAIILSLNFQAAGTAGPQRAWEDLAKLSVSKKEEIEGGGWMASSTSNFRLKDLERVKEGEYIETAFIFENFWERDIAANDLAYRVSVVAAVSPEYASAVNLELTEGQFFTAQDQEQGSRVVLVSEAVSKQLFPGKSARGEKINIAHFGEGNLDFEVIGVYKRPGGSPDFFMPESYLLFPLGFAQFFLTGELVVDEDAAQYGEIYIKSKPGKIYEAAGEAEILLADRSVDDMEVRSEYSSGPYLAEQIRTLSLFLGAFAFVSILISAIGILSIMLVSVVERTREIGLRQTLGASKGIVVRQILNESFLFSVLGAASGLAAAYFTAEDLITLLIQEITYPKLGSIGGLHPKAAVISTALALLVGLVFGLYPAIQAAKMPPVEALRDAC